MAELRTAPTPEQSPMNYEATPLKSGDGIDFHAASEDVSSWAQGHALARAAALDQRLARQEKSSLSPEITYIKQATKLLTGYRQTELGRDKFDLAA